MGDDLPDYLTAVGFGMVLAAGVSFLPTPVATPTTFAAGLITIAAGYGLR